MTTRFPCRKFEGHIGEAVDQDKELYDKMENLREFTYLGVWMSVGCGCEAVVTARTRCRWIMFREYGELVYGGRCPLNVKMAVYTIYLRPPIKSTHCSYDGFICPWNSIGLDLDVGFEWTYGSVGYGKQCLLVWSGVEDRSCSCHEIGIRLLGCKSKEKWSLKRVWKKQVEEGCFEKGRCTLPIKVECWH